MFDLSFCHIIQRHCITQFTLYTVLMFDLARPDSQFLCTCVFFSFFVIAHRSTVFSILISNLINKYNSLTLAPNMPCMFLVIYNQNTYSERKGANDILVVTWCSLWHFLFVFLTLSTMSKKLQDDGKTATTTLTSNILSRHTIKTSRSGSKSDFPNPFCRKPHANFTITDCCSSLSITSGVPTHWRAFERVWSRSLVMNAIIKTMVHV